MKTVKVAAAIIIQDGEVFATRRGYGAFKGWWEFPGGKVKPGEDPKEAAAREIREELNTEIVAGALFDTVEYDYPDFHLSMDCFLSQVKSGDLVLLEHEEAKWLSVEMLESVKWLPADLELVHKIENYLSQNIV